MNHLRKYYYQKANDTFENQYELIRCKVNMEENPEASHELNIKLNMKELFETLNTYISNRSYFSKYVLMYMIEKRGIEGWKDIDNWNLTKEWLIVEYYSEETDNIENLNLPMKDFFKYIKSKQNESNIS